MKRIFAISILCLPCIASHAQQTLPSPHPPAAAPAKPVAQNPAKSAAPAAPKSQATLTAEANAKLYDNAAKLIDLLGTKKQVEAKLDDMIASGKESLQRDNPRWNAQFTEEWAKRMRAQSKVEDYVNVVIRAYENHYTSWELADLIQLQSDPEVSSAMAAATTTKTPTVTPELRAKVKASTPLIQKEIVDGFTQIGAKLGASVGQELAQEHPDWLVGTKLNPATPAQ